MRWRSAQLPCLNPNRTPGPEGPRSAGWSGDTGGRGAPEEERPPEAAEGSGADARAQPGPEVRVALHRLELVEAALWAHRAGEQHARRAAAASESGAVRKLCGARRTPRASRRARRRECPRAPQTCGPEAPHASVERHFVRRLLSRRLQSLLQHSNRQSSAPGQAVASGHHVAGSQAAPAVRLHVDGLLQDPGVRACAGMLPKLLACRRE